MFGKRKSDPLEPYRQAVRDHGAGFESLLWKNRDFQQTRFRVIAEVAADGLRRAQPGRFEPLNDIRIADIGCGNADLYAWLGKAGIDVGAYTGVDGVPEMIESCNARAAGEGWTRAGFVLSDMTRDEGLFPGLADTGTRLVAFSGSLNTFDERDARLQIGRAFDALGPLAGVVFNFLSDMRGRGTAEGPARRFDTVAMITWAFEQSHSVIVRHDYLGAHDCTIGIFKD